MLPRDNFLSQGVMKMYKADSLSNEQLAGQSLVVGFQGTALDSELRFMISQMHIGGIVLFKRNVSDPSQIARLCQEVQAVALETGAPPLMIAIDQEGGPVSRLGPPFTVFPGNRAIGQARSKEAAMAFGITTAQELGGVGITMNLAPVLDVTPRGPESYIMSDRVFGEDPGLAADLGHAIIEGLQQHGIVATAKHFPGLGRSTIDPHRQLPYIDTESHVLEPTDLVPFRAAVQGGVGAVMLSHAVYVALDPLWPASLSSVIAKDLLRNNLGFEGVTMTDDLDMGAIEQHFDVGTIVKRLSDANIDMALICRNSAKIRAVYRAFVKEIGRSHRIRTKRIASVQRVLDLKEKYVT